MLVIDEITGRQVDSRRCGKVVVGNTPENIVFGYTEHFDHCVNVYFFDCHGNQFCYSAIPEKLKDTIFFSNNRGCYMSKHNISKEVMLQEQFTRGRGDFPYNQISKRYEAVESFDIFKNHQHCKYNKEYKLSNYLNYTFGLEFETSEGYVPEDICFRDGLIPLHDGSITGIEYSTVVLSGNEGLNLLRQQLDTLKKYTMFDKECSLHIHFGGYPLDEKAIFRFYQLCENIQQQGDFLCMVPQLTFQTSRYKASGKDYCKFLPHFRDFRDMFSGLVGEPFLGSFEQPHPNDIERKRKWQIPTRYYWVNFINLLCYKVNKTIEFRLLRPTFNFEKITTWIYLMNGLLRFAQGIKDNRNMTGIDLSGIMHRVYPVEVADELDLKMIKLRMLTNNQNQRGDRCGSDLSMEDVLFCNEE